MIKYIIYRAYIKKLIAALTFFLMITGSAFSHGGNDLLKLSLKEDSYYKSKMKLSLVNDIHFKLYPETVKEKKINKIDPLKLTIVGVVGAGAFTAMHIYYANTWWKDQKNYFKFAEDGFYARNIDKVSHIYTANVITEGSAMAYEWAGIKPGNALIYGAVTALAYETYIEINDGFAPNWGFDWVDMGANIFGAAYPFLQREAPVLNNFNFKWSFNPKWLERKVTNKNDLLDDYTNMTFWLSVNPRFIFPNSLTKGKFYPDFLAVALGLSIKNASHTFGSGNAYTEWFLAFDIDVTKLPGKSDFLKKLKKLLNFYHFPTPAVRFSPSGIWYGLYF